MIFSEVGWKRRLTLAHAKGELFDAETFMAKLGWTRAQLDHAVSKYRVFLLTSDDVEYVPSFFFDGRFCSYHVQLVSAALGTVSPGGKWQFFSTGKGSLGGITPLVALARGQVRTVRRCAIACAER